MKPGELASCRAAAVSGVVASRSTGLGGGASRAAAASGDSDGGRVAALGTGDPAETSERVSLPEEWRGELWLEALLLDGGSCRGCSGVCPAAAPAAAARGGSCT